ncbi:LysR substrate-binding domain-containing protein [Methylobacterium oryzihabitans]|uniref:LysR family transcriptional regulator n=1 Tax=Methylobacterium oryzihabitans TaxID=2499852 RepID=A0A437P328_9HYPH|nr:LysR substrate-binding domain-containing protein [Methylobacterium oryzihabitans]RVU16673.1 LysR family transcriptional regulator [Methylobacterium oryzihabitans]
MHPLDLDQLRTLVAIADTGSFTRAAEAVNKTQSAVSMQMKRLEERVGREVFCRAGRLTRLTDDGERLLDYARRIVRLHAECLAAFDEGDLAGRVRLGLPDDYAERYLPEILGRFARTHPRAEVTVVCEPSDVLAGRIAAGDLDLAIVTEAEQAGAVETVRGEALLWVGSNRHRIHAEATVPLALGRPNCRWRMRALASLEQVGRPSRILFVSWSSTAVGAVVLAGLAVSVLPESALKPGMRLLGPADGFPPLPGCRIGLMRHRSRDPNPTADALAAQIRQSLDNLRVAAE